MLSSSEEFPIRIGKLGDMQLQTGIYVYIGSAHGPGGLSARLGHHLKPTGKPHWHIDYLRAHANPEGAWYCYDSRPWEHVWAECIGMLPGASIPLARFGASDCGCKSHLYFFNRQPSRAAFSRMLGALGHKHPIVRHFLTQK
jgi:Uri superfamily endonuclease